MTTHYFGNRPTLLPWDKSPVELTSSTSLKKEAYYRTFIIRNPANFTITLPPSNQATAGGKITLVHGFSENEATIQCYGQDKLSIAGEDTSSIQLRLGTSITLEDMGNGRFIPVYDALAFNIDPGSLAPKDSPVFTGDPQAPTPPLLSDSLAIANTKSVLDHIKRAGFLHMTTTPVILDANAAEIAASGTTGPTTVNLPAGFPDYTGFLFHRLYDVSGFQLWQPASQNRLFWRRRYNSVWQGWNELANLQSPIFTGVPQVPTAPIESNDTTASNTEFVGLAIDEALKRVVLLDVDQTLSSQKAPKYAQNLVTVGGIGIYGNYGQVFDATLSGGITNVLQPADLLVGAKYLLRVKQNSLSTLVWHSSYDFGEDPPPTLTLLGTGRTDIFLFEAYSTSGLRLLAYKKGFTL